jgi:hypothetical protein
MPVHLATVHDIDAMHAVRVAVRENALSDENRVRPEHYRTMYQKFGRSWVHEESHKVVAFGLPIKPIERSGRCSSRQVWNAKT